MAKCSLQTFLNENEKAWDKCVGTMTYAYSTTVNPSIGGVPWELVLSKQPGRAEVSSKQVYEGKAPKTVRIQLMDAVKTWAEGEPAKILSSQRHYKLTFDARIKPLEHAQIDGQVYL